MKIVSNAALKLDRIMKNEKFSKYFAKLVLYLLTLKYYKSIQERTTFMFNLRAVANRLDTQSYLIYII